jgi:hypothetical protein
VPGEGQCLMITIFQTQPFYSRCILKSGLAPEKINKKLLAKFDETISEDGVLLKGRLSKNYYRFYNVIKSGTRNSFNPMFFLEIEKAGNISIVTIKARIAYPIYFFIAIMIAMTIFAQVTLTYGSFQSDGFLGVLFATFIISIFYGLYYIFYYYGFKRNNNKVIKFLIDYLSLTK